MESDFYWKTFESTGSVLEYLHYKEAQENEVSPQNATGDNYADGNTGPCSERSKGRRE